LCWLSFVLIGCQHSPICFDCICFAMHFCNICENAWRIRNKHRLTYQMKDPKRSHHQQSPLTHWTKLPGGRSGQPLAKLPRTKHQNIRTTLLADPPTTGLKKFRRVHATYWAKDLEYDPVQARCRTNDPEKDLEGEARQHLPMACRKDHHVSYSKSYVDFIVLGFGALLIATQLQSLLRIPMPT